MLVSSTMETSLYSVRMRASLHGRHLAGAERIVAGTVASEVLAALTQRALTCPGGPADEIHCSLERIDPAGVRYERLPDVLTCEVKDWQEGRQVAGLLLVKAGVRSEVVSQALALLADGAGPGGTVMRGAVIMDAVTGDRLEADRARGIRVSRMDLAPEFEQAFKQALAAANLGHHRVLEALVLAGKVLLAPGIVAELCWSDDPGYTAGYVADPRGGYQRIPALKPNGDRRGGRVFFINGGETSLVELVNYLERQVVLFNAAGTLSSPQKTGDC